MRRSAAGRLELVVLAAAVVTLSACGGQSAQEKQQAQQRQQQQAQQRQQQQAAATPSSAPAAQAQAISPAGSQVAGASSTGGGAAPGTAQSQVAQGLGPGGAQGEGVSPLAGQTGASGPQGPTGATGVGGSELNPSSLAGAASTLATLGAPLNVGPPPPDLGVHFFSPQSPWNTQVSGFAVDPNSAKLLDLAQRRLTLVELPGKRGTAARFVRPTGRVGLYINRTKWTDPVYDGTGPATRLVCRQIQCGSDAPNANPPGIQQLNIPSNADPDPRYDGWFTVIDRGNGVAYDLWRARRERDESISFQFIRKWQLFGPGFQQPYLVSARGSGLPLFAGLLLPSELSSGRIDHALAIVVPGPAQRRYVDPASKTDGNGDQFSLPEGSRLRLRSSFRAGRLGGDANRTSAGAIITALKTYGAIVVDRGATPSLFAAKNGQWGPGGVNAKGRPRSLLAGDEVQRIRLTDFDVVQFPGQSSFQDPPPINFFGGFSP